MVLAGTQIIINVALLGGDLHFNHGDVDGQDEILLSVSYSRSAPATNSKPRYPASSF